MSGYITPSGFENLHAAAKRRRALATSISDKLRKLAGDPGAPDRFSVPAEVPDELLRPVLQSLAVQDATGRCFVFTIDQRAIRKRARGACNWSVRFEIRGPE